MKTIIISAAALTLTLCNSNPQQDCEDKGGEWVDPSMTSDPDDQFHAHACSECPDGQIIDLQTKECIACSDGDTASTCVGGDDEAGDPEEVIPGEWCILGSSALNLGPDRYSPGVYPAVRRSDIGFEGDCPEPPPDYAPLTAFSCAASTAEFSVPLGTATCYLLGPDPYYDYLKKPATDTVGPVYERYHISYDTHPTARLRLTAEDYISPYSWPTSLTHGPELDIYLPSPGGGLGKMVQNYWFEIDASATSIGGPSGPAFNIDCMQNAFNCMVKCSDDDMCDFDLNDEAYVCEGGYCRPSNHADQESWMDVDAVCEPGELMTGGDCVDACGLGWCAEPDLDPIPAEPDQGDVGEAEDMEPRSASWLCCHDHDDGSVGCAPLGPVCPGWKTYCRNGAVQTDLDDEESWQCIGFPNS